MADAVSSRTLSVRLRFACVFVLLQAGCATVIKGTGEEVRVTSVPAGAQVLIDGKEAGYTPITKRLPHGKAISFVFRKVGYRDQSRTLTASFSGHSLWFGGMSLLFDAMSGSIYTLDADHVEAVLERVPERIPVDQPKRESVSMIDRSAPLQDRRSASSSRKVVAVFDVDDQSGSIDGRDLTQLTEYLAVRLSETCGFAVVPRSSLRELLKEGKAESYRACFDQSCQIELGKALAAEKSVSTRIFSIGGRCVVASGLFDLKTETADRSSSHKTDCGVANLLEATDAVVAKLCH